MKFILLLVAMSFHFSMTIEEKVGQLIICPIHGNQFSEETAQFLKETKVGGVILYKWADNLLEEKKLSSFISDLQSSSICNTSLPLFISIDQEGGRVQRIAMDLPSAQKMNDEGFEATKTYGQIIGKRLNKIGINVNYAPVVDVNSNPNNVIIRDRAFSDDPEKVAQSAMTFIDGLSQEKVFACLKHFPGHGDVDCDSHYKLPVSMKTLDELLEIELKPYIALKSHVSFIMTAHILFPNIDSQNPATTSKVFLTDILRKKLGYQGLIICDSLRMEGILSKSMEEIAIDAFNAGNDILVIGGNRLIETDPGANQINLSEIRNLHKALVKAVKDGRISEKRLDESIERIIKVKNKIKGALS